MIIAVSYSDYNKYGCVKCGCEYCSVDIVSGPSTPVICGECESKFIILKTGLKKSSVGLATQKKDKDGNTIYEFPLLSVHPRKGVLKHPYVRPDIRPDNGIGEFATPRGVGYDIACFVKSKEAGKRIVEMFDKKNKEYEEMGKKFGFSCCLDYRPNEPKWIQVKIEYTNEQRAELLCALIRNNSNIITEEVIESANNMKLTVADRYKLFGVNSLLLNYDFNRKLMLLINNYGSSEYDNNTLQEIYKVNYNLLAQFEMFGTGLQVHSAIHGKETQLGIESLLNFIDKYNDPFNCQMRVNGTGDEKTKFMINSNRDIRDYITEAVEVCNTEEINTTMIISDVNELPKNFKQFDASLNTNDKYEFRNEFIRNIEPLILDYIDWSFLKKVLIEIENILHKDNIVTKNTQLEIYNLINTSKNQNFIAMYSLAGLLYQVQGEFDKKYSLDKNEHFDEVILATSHTLSQLESPVVLKIEKEKNNEEKNNIYDRILTNMKNLSNKYNSLLQVEEIVSTTDEMRGPSLKKTIN